MTPRRIQRPPWIGRPGDLPSVVALGGGHGLAATLSAVRRITPDITAVATVADNGGSSGRLRDELGVLPPGDLRMALAALCGDDEWGRTWADVLQHRFSSGGDLHNHAVGNLLIVALWELLDDHVNGLDLVGQLLGAQGRVLPMSSVPLDIEALVRREIDGEEEVGRVRGQVEVASTDAEVIAVRLDPPDPPACPEAVDAIRSADWVIVGPGSWFTSVIPNLLVPEIFDALHDTAARRIVVLNLAAQPGETEGFAPETHLEVLTAHAPDLQIDTVVADAATVEDPSGLTKAAASLGAELVIAEVGVADGSPRHDPLRLAAVLEEVIG
ncbi:gluconeogenesis factor YvcK family protein [Solicola gregarius]|uniref:Putative gluconeogenesis factor n=1 Tax=Solicola gregarius TaxID=2908642 RepID=A0AA46TGV0_9ACTN|nr:uridine diphosphate-N-acetylglucosamine-binding protein YvcK [Solicola gregarius]UYM04895.1 uridine diphosphate-N-acetylglucosamine-binding protein YvcK [Solicola gregarius]